MYHRRYIFFPPKNKAPPTQATGRCESAVQDWALDKSCEQEHAFVKEDSAGKPRIPTAKCGGLQVGLGHAPDPRSESNWRQNHDIISLQCFILSRTVNPGDMASRWVASRWGFIP